MGRFNEIGLAREKFDNSLMIRILQKNCWNCDYRATDKRCEQIAELEIVVQITEC